MEPLEPLGRDIDLDNDADIDWLLRWARNAEEYLDLLGARREREARLLRKVGSLIRGDWSGTHFDGRDVQKWILTILEGSDLDAGALEARLDQLLENY